MVLLFLTRLTHAFRASGPYRRSFPDFRGWVADSPTMLPASAQRCRKIWYPVQTKAADGGTKPETSGSCSVSSAPSRIAFQRVKGARRTFSARAPPVLLYRKRLLLKLSCIVQGFPHARIRSAKKPTAYRQARHNSRNPTNIAIPFTHRQWQLGASDGNSGFSREVDGLSPSKFSDHSALFRVGNRKAGSNQILHFVEDFAGGLGRPPSGSTCRKKPQPLHLGFSRKRPDKLARRSQGAGRVHG